MNDLKTQLSTILALLMALQTGLAQGPWSQGNGSGFIQVQTTLPAGPYTSIAQQGQSVTEVETNINREVLNANLDVYGIYGLTDRITVFTKLPLKYVATGDATDSLHFPILLEEDELSGLGNMELGIKYGVLDRQLKMAVSLQSSWNTASKRLERGLATGYLTNSFGLFGHVGGNLSPRWYGQLDLGINLATNDFSDFTKAFLEVGYKANQKGNVVLALYVDVRQSLRNGSFTNPNLEQTGLFTNDQEWTAGGLKANWETNKQLGFTLSTAGLFSANRIGVAGALSLGIYKKW